MACAAILLTSVVSQVLGDSLPFVPPAGWSSAQPPRGLLGVWVHAGDSGFRQNIVVGRERTQLSASTYNAQTIAQLKQQMPEFRLGADQYTTTCNGKPAHYLSYSGLVKGEPVLFEEMSTLVGGYAWFAIYARATSEPSLPEAREALTTLCGMYSSPSVPQSQPQPGGPAPAEEPTPTPQPQAGTPEPSPYSTIEPMVDH